MDHTITTKIAIFQKKEIRKTIHNDKWWFVIEDVVFALTDSVQPKGYIKDMRRRDEELSKGWVQIATPLEIDTKGGKQKLNCANTEGIFRIIQSIPSPKVEPFKRWLAKVGYERVQEIEDPELATKRSRAIYKAKGYFDTWIEKRMRGIEVRETLTNEWKKRDVKEGEEYAILRTLSKITSPSYPKFWLQILKISSKYLDILPPFSEFSLKIWKNLFGNLFLLESLPRRFQKRHSG